MSHRKALAAALLVAVTVFVSGLALARYASRELRQEARADAAVAGQRVVAHAERRVADLLEAAAAFSRETPRRRRALASEAREAQRAARAQPPTPPTPILMSTTAPAAGDSAAADDAYTYALWWWNGRSWQGHGHGGPADPRVAKLLDEMGPKAFGAGRVGPALDADGVSVLFVRHGANDADVSTVIATSSIDQILGTTQLAELNALGWDYRLSDDTAAGAHGAIHSHSGVRALEDPVRIPLGILERAWTLELAAPAGWQPPRLFAAHILLVALLSAASGLFIHTVATEARRRAERDVATLRGRLTAVSSQLDRALTDHEQAEDRLRHEAHFDPGTGLANRRAFVSSIEQGLRRVRRGTANRVGVAVLGIRGISLVRDSLGVDASEALLREIGDRITSHPAGSKAGSTGGSKEIARVGDADFGLVVSETDGAEEALECVAHVHEALDEPFECAGQEIFLTAAAGLSFSTTGFERGGQLIDEASLAMQKTASDDPGAVQIFDAQSRDDVLSEIQLEGRLRRAIEDEELEPFFQPIVSAADGSIVGVEVLVRWITPIEGMIPPDRFIPLAEDTGLVVGVDRLVMRRAAEIVSVWRRRMPASRPFYASVNMSAHDLREPDACEYIASVLERTGLSTETMRLELTESAIIGNVTQTVAVVARLREMGFKILLDDFGTGYSSLSYLHRFQFDVLKIDRAFITDLRSEGREHDLVVSIVHLARALKLQVVAEGVETEEQYELLREIGCEYCQGYYFSRPLNQADAEALLFGDDAEEG